MPKRLPEDKQKLLLVLLQCGIPAEKIAKSAGVAKLSVHNWKKRFIVNGQLTSEQVPRQERMRRLFQQWVEHLSNRHITHVLEHEFITPFLKKIQDATSSLGWIFEPTDPYEKFWVQMAESNSLTGKVWDFFREAVIDNTLYDPNTVQQFIVNKFRSGQALPYWPGRVEALSSALEKLAEDERLMIIHKHGLSGDRPKTTREIKQILKEHGYIWYSIDRIRQAQSRATNRLKHVLGGKYLDERRILTSFADFAKQGEDYQNHIVMLESIIRDRDKSIELLYQRLAEIMASEENRLKEVERDRVDELSRIPISALDISVRAYSCLERESIETVGDLIQRNERNLLSIRNFGKGCLLNVKEGLSKLNLSLKETPVEEELDYEDAEQSGGYSEDDDMDDYHIDDN